MAAVAFVLAAYCGVLTWMLFLAHSGTIEDNDRFDAAPPKPIVAVVRTAEPVATPERPVAQHVTYDFFADGQGFSGEGDVPSGTYTEGQRIDVEFVAGTPSINRIAGGRNEQPRWLETVFLLV